MYLRFVYIVFNDQIYFLYGTVKHKLMFYKKKITWWGKLAKRLRCKTLYKMKSSTLKMLHNRNGSILYTSVQHQNKMG